MPVLILPAICLSGRASLISLLAAGEMQRMRRLAAITMVCALATPAAAAEFREGMYAVQGTNLDGSPYKGTAQVTLLSDTTCKIEWDTGAPSSGPCMKVGDYVSAAYVMGNAVGIIMYHVNDDGSLDGFWTVSGQNGSGTEHLTPQ
jgi:hypothetical protein